jgi:hypothetical protein
VDIRFCLLVTGVPTALRCFRWPCSNSQAALVSGLIHPAKSARASSRVQLDLRLYHDSSLTKKSPYNFTYTMASKLEKTIQRQQEK